MTALQSEVVEALIGQGFKPKDAHLKVAGAEGEDFQALFSAAIKAPAKVTPINIDRDKPQPGRIRKAWRALRSIDREAAIDSGKNVFAFLGVGAVLAYMGTMPHWMLAGAVLILVGAWYADYVRHSNETPQQKSQTRARRGHRRSRRHPAHLHLGVLRPDRHHVDDQECGSR